MIKNLSLLALIASSFILVGCGDTSSNDNNETQSSKVSKTNATGKITIDSYKVTLDTSNFPESFSIKSSFPYNKDGLREEDYDGARTEIVTTRSYNRKEETDVPYSAYHGPYSSNYNEATKELEMNCERRAETNTTLAYIEYACTDKYNITHKYDPGLGFDTIKLYKGEEYTVYTYVNGGPGFDENGNQIDEIVHGTLLVN